MRITFKESRDLGSFGAVAAGTTRDDLPEEFAMLQVKYGLAVEAGDPPKMKQEDK